MMTYCLDYHHTYHMLIILLKLHANKFFSFNNKKLQGAVQTRSSRHTPALKCQT